MTSDNFNWANEGASLCNAPLEPMDQVDLDARHPALVFLQYWEKIGGGEVPDRAVFSPMKVPSVLKWFMLFRCAFEEGEDRYHLYLQGSSAAEMTLGSIEGQYLDEFTADYCYHSRRDLMRAVLSTKKPLFGRINISSQGEFDVNVTAGIFPMTDGQDKLVFLVPAPESLLIRRLI